MKQPVIFLICFLTSLVILGDKAASSQNPNTNTVQLAILLDTSNSMDGLIEQAKTQLWKIVNEMAHSKRDGKTINLFVALYEYGNDGLSADEGYIRLVAPLTTDLDKISEELFKLRTNGGSEYCGAVINKAIKNLKWSKSNNEYKVIFIAGNEPFDQGNIDYKTACKEAISKGIIINTIYCGSYDEGYQTNWKDGADLADGKYINIDQNLEAVHIETPFDDELVKLGQKINETYIAYGYEGDELKNRQAEQDKNASTLSPSVMVERTITKGNSQYRNETWDLVDAQKTGTLDLKNIPKNQLPKEMQSMTLDEQKKYIDKKEKEREKYQNRINELDKQRRDYIAQKISENKEVNTLDAAMLKIIREQAGNKNYKFE